MEYTHIINSIVGNHMLAIEDNVVITGDTSLAKAFVGMSKGAVKAICKRRLPHNHFFSIAFLQENRNGTRKLQHGQHRTSLS